MTQIASNRLKQRLERDSIPEPNSGCWLWTASTKNNGYGSVKWQRRTHYAHRLAWIASHGQIPEGQCVCHKCDVRSCINPDHLWLGPRSANSTDMVIKGRQALGERNSGAKLTAAKVLEIRLAKGTQQEIAERFGISRPNVSLIRGGRTWKHLNARSDA